MKWKVPPEGICRRRVEEVVANLATNPKRAPGPGGPLRPDPSITSLWSVKLFFGHRILTEIERKRVLGEERSAEKREER